MQKLESNISKKAEILSRGGIAMPKIIATEAYVKAFRKHYMEEEEIGVLNHFKIYVLAVFLFILLNSLNMSQGYWVQYPAAAWAIGLAIHYFTVKNIHEELDKLVDKAIQSAGGKAAAKPEQKKAKKKK